MSTPTVLSARAVLRSVRRQLTGARHRAAAADGAGTGPVPRPAPLAATPPAPTPTPTGPAPLLPAPGVLAELVRLPAVFTAPGDVLAGAAWAGYPYGARGTAALAACSACLYLGGMALNDWADREVDAEERPERPIPSGRVRPGAAFGVAAGLTAAGLGIAWWGTRSRSATAGALAVAATAWSYDLLAAGRRGGPATIAAARGLNVLLGAGPRRATAAAVPAALTAVHVHGVTRLSLDEVTGSTVARVDAALRTTLAVTAGAALSAAAPSAAPRSQALARLRPRTPPANLPVTLATAGLAAGFAAAAGRPLLTARRVPGPGQVRGAVGEGVRALPLLQATLAAAAGSPLAALPLLGRWAARRTAARLRRAVIT
ncbi:SCO3242 family prenyltransferase [Allostreptomyces psammosilenae]|uniref:4-hydroxybenzoate polyprenyltransferase n=1 Tax=Allostreptomyces psammosilenae TaxID=1892865 RepID=A0A853AAK1_9ACTN|nr:UbiA family prenyltransferase [Allostreptomyces psammosilenae]NYI07402.1 4-hydroxybenzoate polyprenyltransferase [Allostreptomyces psammosilenae]